MEMMLPEMLASLTRQPSVQGFVIWTGVVGATIWLPSLVPSAVQGIVRHFCHATLFGLLVATILSPVRHSAGMGSPFPLLELTALCLAATWSWLERAKDRLNTQKVAPATSHPLKKTHPQDLLNAVRLALWLTLSLMPVVRWF